MASRSERSFLLPVDESVDMLIEQILDYVLDNSGGKVLYINHQSRTGRRGEFKVALMAANHGENIETAYIVTGVMSGDLTQEQATEHLLEAAKSLEEDYRWFLAVVSANEQKKPPRYGGLATYSQVILA